MPIIEKARLRELAEMRTSGAKVLSVYVNLDPSELSTARDREAEVNSLMGEAVRRVRENYKLSSKERRQLNADIERLRQYFDGEFSTKGARALVVFCAASEGLFEVVKLRRPVRSEVVIDDSPFIEPLTAYSGEDGYSVLLISRKSARIFDGAPDHLREVTNIVDEVHRRHDQGGWSQARFQRGIDKEAHDHIKHVAEILFKRFKRGRVERLIIGAHEELFTKVRETLHPYLRERIAGRVDVDVEGASTGDVGAAIAEAIEADRRRIERAWLDRLHDGMGGRGRVASGLDETLAVLSENRVEALLVEGGLRVGGAICSQCGYLTTRDGKCPMDGSALEARDDVIEAAVERALGQSAAVVFVQYHDDLKRVGSIGAVLRY